MWFGMENQPTFSELEQRILALAGGDLPDGPAPFAAIAEAASTDEDTVIALLRGLKERGTIRRFGATLRHQKAGWGHNAMVAWREDDPERAREVGEVMARHPQISHCYIRRTYPEWRYNLYTMIHGRNPGDCEKVAEELSRATGLADYQVVQSVRELKKTSMSYFPKETE